MIEATPSSSPPRAFAQGTGVLLQTVGTLLFLSTCCVCSSSFLWDPVPAQSVTLERARQQMQEPRSPRWSLGQLRREPAKAGLAIMVMAMTVGGLALASLGLGLQADRRGAAVGAVATCLILLAVLIAGGAGLWMGQAAIITRIWHGVLLLIVVTLTGFTIRAWLEVRAAPAPLDVDVIPPGTKIPYSFYHDDPPEVRLAREIAERRARLEQEQRDLDKLERDLHDQNPQA